MDGQTYRRHQQSKTSRRVLSLTIFADGVKCEDTAFTTLIVKVNDLDCDIRSKTFLNGAALGIKPNLNQFLNELVADLKELWMNGIEAEKYGERVYPFMQDFILDGKARPEILLQSHCNTLNHCNQCYVKGQSIPSNKSERGNCWVFIHSAESPKRRSHNESQLVADAIASGDLNEQDLPFNGIKGRTPLYDIPLINIIQQVPSLEPMHTFFAGFILRDFESMQTYSNRALSCYLGLLQREVLQSRMNAVFPNSNFKRSLDPFSKVSTWKCNQKADFFFLLGPVVFRSLLSEVAYQHYLLLVYLISRFWNGGVKKDEFRFLSQLIDSYLTDHEFIYPKTDQTSNLHQIQHLIHNFENIGPYKDKNAFVFESINGECGDMILGSVCLLEQLASRTEENMIITYYRQGQIWQNSDAFKLLGAGRLRDGKIRYLRAKKGSIEVKSLDYYTDSPNKDFYVWTTDGRCYEVKSFFVEENQVLCEAFEIELSDNLCALHVGVQLPIHHIFFAKLTRRIVNFDAQTICELVLYIPEFDFCRSYSADPRKGFIVRSTNQYYN